MRMSSTVAILFAIIMLLAGNATAQDEINIERKNTLYDVLPRWLVDMPTAGTLRKGYYNLGLRIQPYGGGLFYCDIGLSNRLMLGVSYGGRRLISDRDVDWNPRIGFSAKFRVIDEIEVFPAFTVGYTDQGHGAWIDSWDRYEFKSRGFYGVLSRNFYFYQWTSGWHFGMNYSLEGETDNDESVNFFAGIDVAFNYNLALMFEYDLAINDDKSAVPVSGKGRGYLNLSVKWLFTANLELELLAKDLLINRPGDNNTFSREVRLTFIDSFGRR